MDREKIRILRSKMEIPLNVAVKLLEKNNGDAFLSEQEFHHDNIQIISSKTECDYKAAKENYYFCSCDIMKAIERINQKQVVITTGKASGSKIGFILWPENACGEFYKTAKRNDVFISTEDFDIILKAFDSVFPLKDLSNNLMQETFDITGNNFFHNKTCRLVIEELDRIESNDENIKDFLEEVKNWLNDKLIYADYIVVFGTL